MKTIITTLFCLGIFFNSQAQIVDTLVDVGGYKLHFNIIKGSGVPILFESGNGDDGTVWKEILKPIHDATGATLITYDRAGLGLSEIDTSKVNLTNEIKGLEIGLKKLGYTKDIFLVSHSFGGYYSTLYALRNSKKITGSVFIDVLTPCYFTKKRSKETKDSISKEDWAMLKKEAIGLYYVLKNLEVIYDQMKDKSYPITIPATVIGADTPPQMVKGDEIPEWKNCLKTLGSLPNYNYVFAENCKHKVWKDNPELVSNEIVKLYKKVAAGK